MGIDVDIYDVEGLSELLEELVKKVHGEPYRSDRHMYEPAGMLARVLKVINKKLDWLRYKVLQQEGSAPAGTCVLCQRQLGKDWSKKAPQLCQRHFTEWPTCPTCGIYSQGYNMFAWSPKKTVIKCTKCGGQWSGQAMERILLERWENDVLGYF
jgi:hypothetical protein